MYIMQASKEIFERTEIYIKISNSFRHRGSMDYWIGLSKTSKDSPWKWENKTDPLSWSNWESS